MHLLVRHSPLEVAVHIRYVAVERGDRRVDQRGHGKPPSTQTDYTSRKSRRSCPRAASFPSSESVSQPILGRLSILVMHSFASANFRGCSFHELRPIRR